MAVTYKVRIGGLMRCCTATLSEESEDANEMPKEGDTLSCAYCKDGRMRFRDGAWEWAHDEKT